MTIRKSIRVERSPEVSFKVFCEEIGQWWPGGFSGKDSTLFLEGKVGGRFYERRADGGEYEIGRVTAYEPPSLVAFTWRAPIRPHRSRFDSSPRAKALALSWNIADGSKTRSSLNIGKTTIRVGTGY